MDGLAIRSARAEDLGELCRLLAQLTDAPPAQPAAAEAAALAAILASPGIVLLVAAGSGGLVGTITVVIVPNLTHGARPWAQLENMVVDVVARSAGVGRLLLEEAVRLAREAGCYKAQLQSANARDDAHRFYEREGFVASSKGFRRYFEER